MRPIRVLTVLTYYHPHWTGLTAIAKRIAEGLAARGHEVTVLTTQHLPELPRREVTGGVGVVRCRSLGRFSRGVVAPGLPAVAARLIHRHDVVHLHTPLPEAPLVAALARLQGRPVLMTHQGDLVMPAGAANQAVERIGTALLASAGRLATVVTSHSDDYARESSFLGRFAHKLVSIPPPVDLPEPDAGAARAWRAELGLESKALVGFAGRFVEEKGFDYLLRAIPALTSELAEAHLVFAGKHDIEYEDFFARCRPLLEEHRDRVTFVGLLEDRQRVADFYAMCDVFAVPSRTDMLAGAQVEAMLAGTPVVASDIAGARVPVTRTRMGRLVPPGDPAALAAGLAEVLRDPAAYTRTRAEVREALELDRALDAYEELVVRLASRQ
jgi:glycosyltransferase involved in cell wall biosynthesis